MAVDIRDTEVSPLNASLLPSLSCQLNPRHPAGSQRARSSTPSLPSARCFVASWLLTCGQPGQQPGPPTSRSEQLTSSRQSLRPADALDPGEVDGGESLFVCPLTVTNKMPKQLYQQTQVATQTQYDRAGNAIEMADAEIARFQEIVRQIEELQTEFAKIRRIGEIVKAYRARVEALERRI